MQVDLLRSYAKDGTNGEIWVEGKLFCYSIELPWLYNAASLSCIPEGAYFLGKRYSKKFKAHIEIKDVPQRRYILFHPANVASKELRGCIAPVSVLTGVGRGGSSRDAFHRLIVLVYGAIDSGAEVLLVIKRKGLV